MEPDDSQDSTTWSTSMTDERLLLIFRAGDQAAFEEIIKRHESRLARIAYRIVGCSDEAEDVRHAVFVQLWQVVRQPREIEQLGAWLTRCTINEAITRVRRRRLEGRVVEEVARIAPGTVATSPPEQLEADESCEVLSTLLDSLSPDARALLSLRFDENLTFREIAELLNRPASTVKSQVSRAITRLRELVGARD